MILSTKVVRFIAVVELGSIKEASSLLHRTPSTICNSIKNLEYEYGVKLFKKKKNRIVATKDGKEFYHKIIKLSNSIERIEADLARTRHSGYLKYNHISNIESIR